MIEKIVWIFVREIALASSAAPARQLLRAKSLLLCAVVGFSAIAVSSCGSTSTRSASASKPASSVAKSVPHEQDEDEDIDALGKAKDTDGDAILGYGPSAGPADRLAIVTLLKRYYTAGAAADGARACSMLDPLIAEEVLEEHSHGKGPAALQGSTCAQVMTKLFKQRHRELAEDVAQFRVTVVELQGNRGVALMPYKPARETQVILRRDGGVWKMGVPIDNGAQ